MTLPVQLVSEAANNADSAVDKKLYSLVRETSLFNAVPHTTLQNAHGQNAHLFEWSIETGIGGATTRLVGEQYPSEALSSARVKQRLTNVGSAIELDSLTARMGTEFDADEEEREVSALMRRLPNEMAAVFLSRDFASGKAKTELDYKGVLDLAAHFTAGDVPAGLPAIKRVWDEEIDLSEVVDTPMSAFNSLADIDELISQVEDANIIITNKKVAAMLSRLGRQQNLWVSAVTGSQPFPTYNGIKIVDAGVAGMQDVLPVVAGVAPFIVARTGLDGLCAVYAPSVTGGLYHYKPINWKIANEQARGYIQTQFAPSIKDPRAIAVGSVRVTA